MGQKTIKTVLSVNLGNFGSTGKIMSGIGEIAQKADYITYQAYPGHKSNQPFRLNDIIICSDFFDKLNQKIAYYTGLNGCFALLSTIRMLKKIDTIKPDIIHLHNLHNSYINLPLLFQYIKRHNIKVIWTLHDCWSFTGRCPYFIISKCDKWKNGCHDCPYPSDAYPQAKFDRTAKMWKLKKKWFTGVKNMTIVTPSKWLAELVKESYLKGCPVKVINNGINLDVFKPTPSDFRDKYKIAPDKSLILGIAFGWDERKGLDVFIELSKRMEDKFQIVLVGTDANVDTQIPANIISIHKTQNQRELAEIYTAADLFVNPTREENYPTVNMESIACGTPVLTFRTGGSPEIVDETCGCVVDCDDVDGIEREIRKICVERPYSVEQCLEKAQSFDMNLKFKEYVKLYEQQQ